MAYATLVDIELDAIARIVGALDEKGIRINVALWMTSPQYEDGRLVLSSSKLDQSNPLKDYETVAQILHDKLIFPTPPMLILRMKDPFIVALRNLFKDANSVEGMRLGGQMIGNRFISDAYVYRIK